MLLTSGNVWPFLINQLSILKACLLKTYHPRLYGSLNNTLHVGEAMVFWELFLSAN